MGIHEDVERRRKEILTDSYTSTWRDILNQFKEGSLKIDPDYQRLFRWNNDQQTQYIESLLLGLPSPAIFFAENADSAYEILDGLQRLSTVLKFFAKELFGERCKPSTENEEADSNDILIPSILAAGPILPSLENHTAESLPETLLRTIKNARIVVILIKKESDVQARYEVFRRLNRFGALLSNQEIRNAVARLHGKNFPDRLRKLAATPVIVDAVVLSDEQVRRMGVEESILRLLAFYFSKEPAKHDVTEFLDQFMIHAAQGKFDLTDEISSRIVKTFELLSSAIPDGRAFRFPKGGFSTNLFDVVAIGVFHNLEQLDAKKIQSRHASLLASEEIKTLTGAGSNTRKKLSGRIDLGKIWFGK